MNGHVKSLSANIHAESIVDRDGPEYSAAIESWNQSVELAPDAIEYAVRQASLMLRYGDEAEAFE